MAGDEVETTARTVRPDDTARARPWLWLIVVAGLALAYSNRFVQDDAFITFRYAHNWVSGHGPLFNPGDPPVEGYSNFTWLVLIAAGMRVGIEPVFFSQLLGLLSLVGTVLATYRAATLVCKGAFRALFVCALLLTNYTFVAYATGGLETQFQACLILWMFVLVIEAVELGAWGLGRMVGISALAGLAIMTRPDSGLLVGVLAAGGLFGLWRSSLSRREKLGVLGAVSIPGLLLAAPWLAWKISYYGELLPNTYYAKAVGTSMFRGRRYLVVFALSYLLFPAVGATAVVLVARARKAGPAVWIAASTITLWCLYLMRIGGGWMEFRLLVPVLPLFFILFGWAMFGSIPTLLLRVALVGITLVGTGRHTLTYERTNFIWPIHILHTWVWSKDPNMLAIGQTLGDMFNVEGADVTIAVTPAGAPPYWSGLRTIDMYGLNDRWVARNGVLIGTRPGHQRFAPVHYLVEQRVNLVVGTPRMEPIRKRYRPPARYERFLKYFRLYEYQVELLPDGAQILEIPLNSRQKLVVLYLVQNDWVDRVIEEHGLRTHRIPLYDEEGRRNGLLRKTRAPPPEREDATLEPAMLDENPAKPVAGDPPLRREHGTRLAD